MTKTDKKPIYRTGEFDFGRVVIPNEFDKGVFDLVVKVTKTARMSLTKWWRAN